MSCDTTVIRMSSDGNVMNTPNKSYLKSFCENYMTKEFSNIWGLAPTSDHTKTVFPWNSTLKEYSMVNFDAEVIEHRATFNDIDLVTESIRSIKNYDFESVIKRKRLIAGLLYFVPIMTILV